jgi:hypothetical protein
MSASRPAYQPDRSSARIVVAGVAGVLALIPVAVAAAGLILWAFERSDRPQAATPLPAPALAGPRLEAHPLADRQAVEGPARARLESFGWSDRARGLAHIPIERAMQLQAAEGWPDPDEGPR